MEIVTDKFSISRGVLLKSALMTRSFRWVWVILGVLVCTGAVCGVCLDWRWWLVTVMLLLVLAPGVMALLYLNCALSPRCITEVYPHTVRFDDTGITVRAEVPPLPAQEDEEETKIEEVRTLEFGVDYNKVRKVRMMLNQMVIYLQGNPVGIVHVPYDVLPDAREDSKVILQKIGEQ